MDCASTRALVCSPSSIENVKTKWWPEIRRYAPGVPFILVGTKSDLRDKSEVLAKLRSEGKSIVTPDQGRALAEEIGAKTYLECSSLTQQGLKAVFDEGIKTALEFKLKPSEKDKKKCVIM